MQHIHEIQEIQEQNKRDMQQQSTRKKDKPAVFAKFGDVSTVVVMAGANERFEKCRQERVVCAK